MDINCTDLNGVNLLMKYLDCKEQNFEIVKFLVASGISINHRDYEGKNALLRYFNKFKYSTPNT